MHKHTPEDESESADSTPPLTEWNRLPRSFFNAPPDQVARALLGKVLVRRYGQSLLSGRIVETEAYLGKDDPAAHAASGRTKRNAVLYGPPGYAYVYNIYGLHQCLNVSCLPDGTAGCVLFRALEPLTGEAIMRRNRGLDATAKKRQLTSGPGKICQALGVTCTGENGVDYTCADSPLGLYDDGFECGAIAAATRVGIRKAIDLPLRFFLVGNDCVSARTPLSGISNRRQQNIINQSRGTDVSSNCDQGPR